MEARRLFTSACRSFTKSTTLDFVFLAMGHRSALTYAGLRTLFHRTVDTFRLHRHFLPLSFSLFLIARFLATSSGPLTIIFISYFLSLVWFWCCNDIIFSYIKSIEIIFIFNRIFNKLYIFFSRNYMEISTY